MDAANNQHPEAVGGGEPSGFSSLLLLMHSQIWAGTMPEAPRALQGSTSATAPRLNTRAGPPTAPVLWRGEGAPWCQPHRA